MERRNRQNAEADADAVHIEELEFKRKLVVQEIGYRVIERSVALPDSGQRWEDRGLCSQVGYEVFFPGKGETSANAKKVCGSCKVKAICLEAGLSDVDAAGIWGGTTERERRRMRRQRKRFIDDKQTSS